MNIAFTDYAHAVAALAGWGLLMMVLSLMSTSRLNADNRTTSGLPKREYSDPGYRRFRAYANAVETTGPFLAVTLAAILSGANPFWVNLLASVFLVSRVAMAVIHMFTQSQSARSASYIVGWLCMFGLAVLAIVGAFSGGTA